MKRLLVATAAAALFFVAPADARTTRVESARAIAVAYWGGAPAHCPAVRTVRADLSYAADGREAEAWPAACTIRLDRAWLRWLNDAPRWDRPWARFCTVYVHEWGHLLGLAHSADPTDVMYPTVDLASVDDCRAARRTR